jgi:hypothetical protein
MERNRRSRSDVRCAWASIAFSGSKGSLSPYEAAVAQYPARRSGGARRTPGPHVGSLRRFGAARPYSDSPAASRASLSFETVPTQITCPSAHLPKLKDDGGLHPDPALGSLSGKPEGGEDEVLAYRHALLHVQRTPRNVCRHVCRDIAYFRSPTASRASPRSMNH